MSRYLALLKNPSHFRSTKEVWFSLPSNSRLTNRVFRRALLGSQAMRLVESVYLILWRCSGQRFRKDRLRVSTLGFED